MPTDVHCSALVLGVGGYTSGRKLALAPEEYLYVVPFAGFRLGSPLRFADLTCSTYYIDFLKGQPDPAPPPAEKGSSSRTKEQDALLKKHPWMSKTLERKRLAQLDEEDEPEPEQEQPEEVADVTEAVMQRLSLIHPELSQLHEEKAKHFEIYLRREYAMRGAGKQEADSARAQALASTADWCRRHGLAMSSTFSFKGCKGAQGAHRLAQQWCRRMQYFFDCHELEGDEIDWPRTIASFQLDADFEAWVTSCDSAYISQRAAQLMAIMPR